MQIVDVLERIEDNIHNLEQVIIGLAKENENLKEVIKEIYKHNAKRRNTTSSSNISP